MAVSVQRLGKRYQIAHEREHFNRLSEALMDIAKAPLDRVRGKPHIEREWFWALRDATFDVAAGGVVGVIGRNGAGKSTLLKILARITEPTTGEVQLRGRVASLLEVGTGFHSELTGRENIFLSGSILGMRRAEISARFDEIVEFAGVEQFLDTPVKRYSSGMQVRLGFAVAAHLEPEILLIDEVLAVGDAEFQKRCLGKMAQIGDGGRSILFVSHSMPAVLRLCDQAILLDRGLVVTAGDTASVVRAYLESDAGRTSERTWESEKEAPGDDVARLKSVKVIQTDAGPNDEVDIRRPIRIEVEYWSRRPGSLRPSVNLHFYNDQGVCIFVTNDWNDQSWASRARRPGIVRATCHVPGNFLAEGRVSVLAAVSTYNPLIVHAREHDAVAFQVVDRSEGDGVRGEYTGEWPGVVRPLLEWDVEQTEAAG